ncbi:TonB family protein [Luteimonas sp. R10]|uniref:TonB family protein n=1 Tax=Luteimonas sp. R10 TaxID=3108176 RepID=UPI0030908B05|nr:TonB family protein [Luteimonas sp. R10]
MPRPAALALGGLAMLLAGCGGERAIPEPERERATSGQEGVPAPGGVGPADDAALQRRAAEALRAGRLYAPAGDNAVEHYLALRERRPGDAGVHGALTELQPYLLIAAEQALARDAFDEVQRLLELVARNDPGAPALPRLREDLQAAWAAVDSRGAPETASAPVPDRPQAPVSLENPTTPDRPVPSPSTAARTGGDETGEPPASAPAREARPAPGADSVAAPALPPSPRAASSPSAAGPVVADVAPPRLLEDLPPRYPLIALNRRVEGHVVIVATIAADGRVTGARVQSAQPEDVFDRSALTAARHWRFEPGAHGRTVVRTIRFTLPGGGASR